MAVSTTNGFDGPYLANGATTSFPFTFTAPSADEVAVLLRAADGAETVATGYTVTLGSESGGSVVFSVAPASGVKVIPYLNPEFTQQVSFDDGSAWLAAPVNEGYDRSASRDQALKRDLGRAVLAPIDEAGTTLPPVASRIGKFLAFDAAGKAYATDGTGDGGSVRPDLAATTGAALVGKSGSGTVQSHIDLWSTKNYGAVSAGTTADTVVSKTFSGHSGGTTDFRGLVYQTNLTGGNSVAEVDQVTAQLELNHTANTLTSAFGRKAYARLGLSGSTTGNVTSIRVYDTHVANEGTGTIATATCFFADEVDLLDGTGPIQNMIGFYAGNQSHATRVTQKAIGFNAGNMLEGAPLVVGFRSEMQAGTNKFGFLSEGNAVNQFRGATAFGSATVPTDVLELFQGYAKLCGSTTKFANGNYHEMRTGNNGAEIAVLSHSGTSPLGIRIRLDQAANDATGYFVRGDTSNGDMFFIRRNGAMVNQTNSYGAISDERLKEDIAPAPAVLDKFRDRQFVTYRLKSGGETTRGVIAQAEQAISPELVTEGEHLTYNYAGLGVETAQAVKELLALVDSLTKRVAELEGK